MGFLSLKSVPNLPNLRLLVVELLSRVSLSVTLWTTVCQASLSSTISKVCSNSCPLSQWCQQTISSSASPFSFCPQSFPASRYFPVSLLFISGGQSIRASASAPVLPMNIQDWFPLGLTDLIFLLSKGLARVFSSTTINSSTAQPSVWSNSHIHTWLLGKTIALTLWTFVSKVMSLLFHMHLGLS